MDLDTILNIKASKKFSNKQNIITLYKDIDIYITNIDTEIQKNQLTLNNIKIIYEYLKKVYSIIVKYNISRLQNNDLESFKNNYEFLENLETENHTEDNKTLKTFKNIYVRLKCIFNAIDDYQKQFINTDAQYHQYCYGF